MKKKSFEDENLGRSPANVEWKKVGKGKTEGYGGFNSKQAVGGEAPAPLVFCPTTLVFDTITVKFCDF